MLGGGTGTSLRVLRDGNSLSPAAKSLSSPLFRTAMLLRHMDRWQAGRRDTWFTGGKRAARADLRSGCNHRVHCEERGGVSGV